MRIYHGTAYSGKMFGRSSHAVSLKGFNDGIAEICHQLRTAAEYTIRHDRRIESFWNNI